MSVPFIKAERLSHKYSNNWAIKDIDFEISKIGIYGLLGSNGAGKSTTMNILCGVLKQTSGKVLISGIDILENPVEAKKNIGFLPQQAPLYLDLTVREFLKFCAQLRLVDDSQIPQAVEEVLAKTGIKNFGDRLIKNLSGGYKQRVGIAQAIIHKPQIVILDEPTNGLDPNQIVEVRKLIKEIAADRVVLISSHVLSEIQLLSDEILMIENGELIFSDSMEAFNNYMAPSSILVQFNNMPLIEDLSRVEGVTRVEMLNNKKVRIYFEGDDQIAERIIETSVHKRWQLREISVEKNSMDEIFKQLTEKAKVK
jgi:ABC-2 type transport system ATP-binding protein